MVPQKFSTLENFSRCLVIILKACSQLSAIKNFPWRFRIFLEAYWKVLSASELCSKTQDFSQWSRIILSGSEFLSTNVVGFSTVLNRPHCLRIILNLYPKSLRPSVFLLRVQHDSQGLLKGAQAFPKSLSGRAKGNIGSESLQKGLAKQLMIKNKYDKVLGAVGPKLQLRRR